MIERIRLVALRDFVATLSAKGFLVGLVIAPTIILLSVLLGPRLLKADVARVSGQIEVVDPTGAVVPRLQAAIDSKMITVLRGNGGGQLDERWLLAPSSANGAHLAIVSVQPDAVVGAPGHAGYGSYSLFLAANVDPATEAFIRKGMRTALIAARFRKDGIDPQSAESMLSIAKPHVAVVTHAGQQPPRPAFAMFLPLGCSVLLLLGVTMGGQLLLTSTVEEKASRVVDVLLAAVSPVELMAGKLIGQIGVGLLMVGMYVGVGVAALGHYSLVSRLDPMLLVYLVLFYLLAYLVYGSLMLAIGAAVSQVAEAQSLPDARSCREARGAGRSPAT